MITRVWLQEKNSWTWRMHISLSRRAEPSIPCASQLEIARTAHTKRVRMSQLPRLPWEAWSTADKQLTNMSTPFLKSQPSSYVYLIASRDCDILKIPPIFVVQFRVANISSKTKPQSSKIFKDQHSPPLAHAFQPALSHVFAVSLVMSGRNAVSVTFIDKSQRGCVMIYLLIIKWFSALLNFLFR